MILDPKRNTSPRVAPMRMGLLTLAALLIAVAGIGAAPRLALAAPESATETTATVSSSDAAEVVTVVEVPEVDPLLADAGDVHVEITTTTDEDDIDRPKEKPARDGGSEPRDEYRSSRVIVRSSGASTLTAPHEKGHVIVLGTPTPAPHPVPALPPESSAPPRPPKPPHAAFSTGSASIRASASDDSRSLEERMRRLERLVESLVQKRTNPELIDPQFHFRFEGLAKSMEQVSKDVERSVRDAERKLRETQQRSADLAREKAQVAQAGSAEKSVQLRRKALEQQRKMLRKQIEEMQSHVDRLESQLDHLDDEFESAAEAEAERAEGAAPAAGESAPAKDKVKEKTKLKHPDGKPEEGKVKDPFTPAPHTPGNPVSH